MDLQTATTALRSKVGTSSELGATLKFDCGDDGVIVIDGASTPSSVDNTDRDTDCTITLSVDTLGEMMSGELNPTTAFMTGRIKVSGDMGVALKLQSVF
ncbi:MAG TPA: SCP2 sterol-binding domain-containing protein [Burkholderiaceae bacterium]|nr:SCP2 sterol-binding domain-containing protein [Burkholderiaceae bacterium]